MSTKSEPFPMSSALSLLRLALSLHQPALDAYLIPSSDEYLNEYLPHHLNRRKWLTEFTGSAGDALVTTDKAYVFADGRYHEQVDNEIDATQWTAVKVGQKDAKPLTETLKALAKEGSLNTLGYPATCTSARQAETLHKSLAPLGVTLVATETHLLDTIWDKTGRSAPVHKPITELPVDAAGQSVAEKLKAVRDKMADAGCTALPIDMLDQIAWLFNLRGSDIPYNPVFLSKAIVTDTDVLLFVPEERIPVALPSLADIGMRILPMVAYAHELALVSDTQSVWVDKGSVTAQTLEVVTQQATTLHEATSPVTTLKAIKNKAEIAGMEHAHVQAGVAWLKARYWLHQQTQQGNSVSEKSFADMLYQCYSERPGFVSLSFNTISGMGAHGAIIHYGTPSDTRQWQPGELFLVDSGAQFGPKTQPANTDGDSSPIQTHECVAGTTDTTRTFVFGTPTPEQQFAYTQVLKAHIAGSLQYFPKGTTGAQLDGIVRSAMWQAGLDFMHGTGHGVGAYLNVHEGPCGISKGYSVALEPGMMVSNEPGYYVPGEFGIRLENVVVVEEIEQTVCTTGEPMLNLRPLTMMPFEPSLIDTSLLTQEQRDWLNRYHQKVLKTLRPMLTQSETQFLASLCEALKQ